MSTHRGVRSGHVKRLSQIFSHPGTFFEQKTRPKWKSTPKGTLTVESKVHATGLPRYHVVMDLRPANLPKKLLQSMLDELDLEGADLTGRVFRGGGVIAELYAHRRLRHLGLNRAKVTAMPTRCAPRAGWDEPAPGGS